MKTKKDYNNIFNALREIVNKYDPMGLMDIAPKDEYEMEVGKILASTYKSDSLMIIEKIIYNIFVSNFGDDAKLAKDRYHEIAKEWLKFKNDKIIST